MKTTSHYIIASLLTAQSFAAPSPPEFRSYVSQTQLASGVFKSKMVNDTGVAIKGSLTSLDIIEAGGARFDIYSVLNVAPFTSYLLSSTVVGAMPKASVVIDTEDPYGKANRNVTYANPGFAPLNGSPLPIDEVSAVRRTRVDRPFKVYVTTSALSTVTTDSISRKKVDFRRQVLSYGTDRTGESVSRTPALYGPTPQSSFSVETTVCDEYFTKIPSPTLLSTRGEEIFSVWTLNDTQTPGLTIPPNMLASHRVQICPMTTGSISGISEGQKIRFVMPKLAFNFENTYPQSDTYARIYKGAKQSGVVGARIPGSGKFNSGNNPEDYLATSGDDINPLITSDGTWTIELVTHVDCFNDTLCFAWRTFEVDRTIKANGNFTTIE